MRRVGLSAAAQITGLHFRQWRRTPRALIAISSMLLLGLMLALPYRAELIAKGLSVTPGEVEMIATSAHTLYAAFMYLYLISDLPLDSNIRDYVAARIGRTRCLLGDEAYLLLSALLFAALPPLAALLTISSRLVPVSQWSAYMLKLCGLSKTPDLPPLVFAVSAYLRSALYLAILGNVLMIGNSCFKERYGYLFSAYLHGFFWAMNLDGIWGRLSLFSYSGYSLNLRSGAITIAIDLAIILVMYCIIRYVAGGRMRRPEGGSND